MAQEQKIEPIQTVERALQMMEALSENGSMSLNELHKEIGVNKASLLRLAYTMVQCGYVDKNPENGDYILTTKAYEVGLRSIKNIDKFSLINSFLAQLSEETGRIAQFSIEDKNELLCLQSIGQKSSSFSVYTNVGNRSPLYCTSAGKALLACCSTSQVISKWEKMDVQALTEHTITDIHTLQKELSEIKIRGYAVDREENEYNVFCVGAAVIGASNTPIGAISISGRSLTKDEERDVSDALLSSVKLLSELCGHIQIA